jgi:endonuclease V-like protein UPF0215 family
MQPGRTPINMQLMKRRLSYVIGIDDAPFAHSYHGDVPIIGAVFNGARLEGVLMARVRRDGANATENVASMIEASRFGSSLQAVLLQGITLAGFNVVDLAALSARLDLPVVTVCRRRPDLGRIRRALLDVVPGGKRKWRLIERVEPPRKCGDVYAQSVGLAWGETVGLIERFAMHSHLPEPLRTAHLIAGALATGESRHRA